MSKFSKTLLATTITFVAGGVNAAAFQLAEVSTSGLGIAYAGNAAVADNASVVATNPALMTKFKRAELSAGGVLVDTDLHVKGTTELGNSANQNNIVPTSLIPNAYFVTPITDKFALGLGYNVNYGLKSEYSNDFNAGTMGGKTELAAHNFNLSGAYDLGYGFSFGAGVNAIYSKAEVRRTLGDQVNNPLVQAGVARANAGATLLERLPNQSMTLAQLVAAIPASPELRAIAAQNPTAVAALQGLATRSPNATVGQTASLLRATANTLSNKETEVSRIRGEEWSFGWNAGLTYELNENHRWGLAYHSAIDVKFKGKYRNALVNDLGSIIATNGVEKDGKLTLNLPAYWELSGYHKLTDRFAVQYSWKRTEWSRLKQLDAYSLDDQYHYFHKAENFRDSNRYALGVSYDATEDLTLRAGMAYDRSASVANPSISIPDTNRVWYSAGATYRFTPALSVDGGFSFLRGTRFSFNEDGAAFKTKARGYLYGLNLNYKF
ncbi:MAG: outer membrane protein transport protein [Actinobacillus minor]|nr:outer membrane protein transport protein [Actinobacillus minor]